MVQVRRSLSITRLRSCHDADDRGWSPLHVAARKGDLKQVRPCIYSLLLYFLPTTSYSSFL
jgi:ankyrin repeat protein